MPALRTELFEITALLKFRVPELNIAPPLSSCAPPWVPRPLPPVTVRPEIETENPDAMVIARAMPELLLASIVRLEAPGPLMLRLFVLITRGPPDRKMVDGLGRLKLMVSPGNATAIASRSDPGPLSAVLVTVRVAPDTGTAAARINSERMTE
jgi:hypothetical protein